MTSPEKVQAYLAYWFQLGKPVIAQSSHRYCLPTPIFQGGHYSFAFQQCWQRILQNPAEYYLSGTDETIAALLSDEWDIVSCARCPMPVPVPVRGIKQSPCPCADLSSWPNDQVPMPRSGIDTSEQLNTIRQRLTTPSEGLRDRLKSLYQGSPNLPQSPLSPPAASKTPPIAPAPDAR
jgi:hypothetical protein